MMRHSKTRTSLKAHFNSVYFSWLFFLQDLSRVISGYLYHSSVESSNLIGRTVLIILLSPPI